MSLNYLLVFLGGGLGSLLRYRLGRTLPATLNGTAFPLSILLVNVLASAVLGFVAGWLSWRGGNESWRLLLGVGVCGGLSTFSSFSQDNLALLQQGRAGTALLNIGLNVLGCLLASAGGWALAKGVQGPTFKV